MSFLSGHHGKFADYEYQKHEDHKVEMGVHQAQKKEERKEEKTKFLDSVGKDVHSGTNAVDNIAHAMTHGLSDVGQGISEDLTKIAIIGGLGAAALYFITKH